MFKLQVEELEPRRLLNGTNLLPWGPRALPPASDAPPARAAELLPGADSVSHADLAGALPVRQGALEIGPQHLTASRPTETGDPGTWAPPTTVFHSSETTQGEVGTFGSYNAGLPAEAGQRGPGFHVGPRSTGEVAAFATRTGEWTAEVGQRAPDLRPGAGTGRKALTFVPRNIDLIAAPEQQDPVYGLEGKTSGEVVTFTPRFLDLAGASEQAPPPRRSVTDAGGEVTTFTPRNIDLAGSEAKSADAAGPQPARPATSTAVSATIRAEAVAAPVAATLRALTVTLPDAGNASRAAVAAAAPTGPGLTIPPSLASLGVVPGQRAELPTIASARPSVPVVRESEGTVSAPEPGPARPPSPSSGAAETTPVVAPAAEPGPEAPWRPSLETAGVLTALPAADVAAVEEGMRQFLERLDLMGRHLAQDAPSVGPRLWVVAVTAAAAACEIGRRQLRRSVPSPAFGLERIPGSRPEDFFAE